MMEFLVALVPVMVAFLAVVQFGFAAVAKLVVRHAAALGVRAAVVVIEEYDGQPGTPMNIYNGRLAGVLDEQSTGADPASSNQNMKLRNLANAVSRPGKMFDKVKAVYDAVDSDDSRIKQIRKAVAAPFLGISPNVLDEGLEFIAGGSSATDSVEAAIGDSGASRLAGAFIYNLGAVAVCFPRSEKASEYREEPYQHGDEVRLRVSYLFRCRVPLISLLMCDAGWALFTGSAATDPAALWEARQLAGERPSGFREIPEWSKRLDRLRSRSAQRQKRIDAYRDRRRDFEQVESSTIQRLLLFQPGARYIPIQAEAMLPLQSARYYPRGS